MLSLIEYVTMSIICLDIQLLGRIMIIVDVQLLSNLCPLSGVWLGLVQPFIFFVLMWGWTSFDQLPHLNDVKAESLHCAPSAPCQHVLPVLSIILPRLEIYTVQSFNSTGSVTRDCFQSIRWFDTAKIVHDTRNFHIWDAKFQKFRLFGIFQAVLGPWSCWGFDKRTRDHDRGSTCPAWQFARNYTVDSWPVCLWRQNLSASTMAQETSSVLASA
jgi:hypothetical protein